MMTTLLIILRTQQGINIFLPYLSDEDNTNHKENGINLMDSSPANNPYINNIKEHEEFISMKNNKIYAIQNDEVLDINKKFPNLSLMGLVQLVEKVLIFPCVLYWWSSLHLG